MPEETSFDKDLQLRQDKRNSLLVSADFADRDKPARSLHFSSSDDDKQDGLNSKSQHKSQPDFNSNE